MFPITLKESGFEYGPVSISYSSVTAAGIGVRGGRRQSRTLLIGHGSDGLRKPRLIRFGLKPGADGAAFAAAFQARVNNRWKGEAAYDDMRKSLGFSNGRKLTIVAALVILSFVVTALLIRNAPRAQSASPTSAGAHSARTH